MKRYDVFILVAYIHSFVYISNGVVTMGYVHVAFITFFRDHVTTGDSNDPSP